MSADATGTLGLEWRPIGHRRYRSTNGVYVIEQDGAGFWRIVDERYEGDNVVGRRAALPDAQALAAKLFYGEKRP